MTVAVDGVEARAEALSARRQRQLSFGVAAAAVLSVVSGAVIAQRYGAGAAPVPLLVAAGAFGVSQLARISVRLGSDMILVAWGEVGIVAELWLIPSVWLPAATAVGAALAHLPRLVGATAAKRARIWYAVTSLTTGGAVAAGVAAATSGYRRPVAVDLNRPVSLLPLLGAVLAYFLVTSLLTSALMATSTAKPVGRVWLRGIRATRLMFAGHLAVGLAIVTNLGFRWLIVFSPVLWLVHQAYTYQLRGVEEHAVWLTLADATRRLNQLGEPGVVTAALRGAVELSGCDEVEVVLFQPPGRRRSYRVMAGEVRGVAPNNAVVVPVYGGDSPPGGAVAGVVEARQLTVGGFDIGELRLHFRRRTRLSPSTLHAFSTFADAVASALHDAMTNSQLQTMAARSAHDAAHDTLTGLSNRTAMLVRGTVSLQRLAPDQPIAVILLGLDGFREINETLGRLAGENLLRVLARRLGDMVRPDEVIGRLGGDEFVVLLAGRRAAVASQATWDYPMRRARMIAEAFAAPAEVSGVSIPAETSAGVVVDTAGGCDMTELLRRADIALHQAKRQAIRVAQYHPGSDVASPSRLALLADLRDALAAEDQLTIELQPTVDLRTGRPIAVEALARWRHPSRGLLSSAEYTEVIEHSELATRFAHHTLDLTLAVAATWARCGVAMPIAVNLCRRCMLDQWLPERVVARLAAYGVPASQLIVEVTETAIAIEYDLVEPVILGLRAAGVQISLDDFGTSTASLSFLANFPVDEVKIDCGFVAGMAESLETAAIVRATVDLAKDLGLRVVAQGVERQQQADALLELGVTAAQGRLFHSPMGIEEATVLVGATGLAGRFSDAGLRTPVQAVQVDEVDVTEARGVLPQFFSKPAAAE